MRLLTACLAFLLLATIAHAQTRYEWTGGNGDWSEPTNWSPVGVPAVTDTAVIGEMNQGERIAVLTANTTVAGLELIRLGVIAGDFDLAVTDELLWGGGGSGFDPFRGSGAVTIGPDAILRVTEGAGRFRVGPERTIVNEGLLVWEAPVRWDGEGRVVNDGEIDLAFSVPEEFIFVFSSLADAVTNTADGVIRRTGSGDARYVAGLVSDGLVRVENGGLDLLGFNAATGTTGSGSIEVEPGATLIVGSGNHTQSSITGEALTFMEGNGRLTVTDAYDVATTRFESGNGRLVLDAAGTTDTYVQTGGALDGSGALTVTGSLDWSGGRMEGSGTTTLGPSVPLTIGAANVSLGGSRTLRTEGPVTWTGDADLSSGTSATVFENAGTLTSTGPGERGTTFVTFRNEGTLVHDGGTLHINSPMANEGTVRIADGTFRLGFNASGTDTGRYEIDDTGRLDIAVQSRTFAESAEFGGTGAVQFTSGAALNRATWRPGASPGTLTIDSIWPAPEPEAVLDIEIGGAAPGTEFDQVVVNGEAALGGTLRVTLLDGFTPTLGDRFLIVAASAGASGAFDALDLPDGLDAFIDADAAGAELVIGMPVAGEGSADESLPTAFALGAPYPNPFAGRATLRYDVPESAHVRLVVYDVLGREVAVLADADRAPGRYEAALDAVLWPSGVYLVRLIADDFAQTRRVTLLR
jgi:hypothetical protein